MPIVSLRFRDLFSGLEIDQGFRKLRGDQAETVTLQKVVPQYLIQALLHGFREHGWKDCARSIAPTELT